MKKKKTTAKKDGRSPALARALGSVSRLKRENSRLRNALDRIANPISWMRRDAEEQGARLDGHMAAQLANSASYLQQIAERTLSPNVNDEPRR